MFQAVDRQPIDGTFLMALKISSDWSKFKWKTLRSKSSMKAEASRFSYRQLWKLSSLQQLLSSAFTWRKCFYSKGGGLSDRPACWIERPHSKRLERKHVEQLQVFEGSYRAVEFRKFFRPWTPNGRAITYQPRLGMCGNQEGELFTAKDAIIDRWTEYFESLPNISTFR